MNNFTQFIYLPTHTYLISKKFLVCENLLGNKCDSDFDTHSDIIIIKEILFSSNTKLFFSKL